MTAAVPRDATVAVIGAGTMGAGIAQIAALHGNRVQLHDARFGAADAAKKAIADALASQVAKGRLGASENDALPECILASNTSSISITALAAGMKHPDRVVGMHFFNPAPLMPLVEVVSGLATSPDVVEI